MELEQDDKSGRSWKGIDEVNAKKGENAKGSRTLRKHDTPETHTAASGIKAMGRSVMMASLAR